MIDAGQDEVPPWVPVLRDFARASGHELRNALNALVVNLAVVRTKSSSLDQAGQEFLDQAVQQSEESVRLAEGTIALLNIIVGAIREAGALEVEYVSPRGARIAANESDAARVQRALAPLVARAGLIAEATGSTVILSIPDRSPDTNEGE